LFLGKTRSINSVVLLSNGISFAIQIIVFLVIGSFADFGNWRPNILIALSIIAYAIGFAWLGVHTEDNWHIGVGLHIVGLIAYQTTLTFWTAAFPSLARNTAEMISHADELASGRISREEYEFADMMKRSQLANVAFYVQSVGEIGILAVLVGVMFGVDINASTANNNLGLSVLIACASGIWLLFSLPWFFLEKRRPGQDPGKKNVVLAGLSRLSYTLRQVFHLKQAMLYLVGGCNKTVFIV
jgi:MFS-type transporter involved in bile tolerance (Atg22 family)